MNSNLTIQDISSYLLEKDCVMTSTSELASSIQTKLKFKDNLFKVRNKNEQYKHLTISNNENIIGQRIGVSILFFHLTSSKRLTYCLLGLRF